MSNWTHAICDDCYAKREPGREPVRLVNRELEHCCFCGDQTLSGIYYRHAPSVTPLCRGHEE